MQAMDEGAIAIVPTAPVRARNRDIEYPFRPDSDFYYLTGFDEPEAVAALVPGREQGEYILFCRERDLEMEQWNGRRAGLEGACERFGADDAFPIGDIDDILPGLLENRDAVYYAMGCYPEFDQRMLGWVKRVRDRSRAGVSAPGEFVALDHMLHDMRLVKSGAEVRAMRKAGDISARAHRRAMQMCRPGMREYQIEAEILHEFMLRGARSTAYPSIVAGGANACILHYIENTEVLRDGDLLLIDAGAEYDCYASDITRTFPIGGKFSAEQRALYEVVLAAQRAAIDKVQPGNHWHEAQDAAVEVMVDGLIELGLLKGRRANILNKERYRKFYMHRIGHWLGMDVHDVGDYKIEGEWRVLEPGMVTTVEIEDDVLVTRDGHEVLTDGVPKAVDEVEALVGAAPLRAA
jgi:Xaa-Pro aminopeptidase